MCVELKRSQAGLVTKQENDTIKSEVEERNELDRAEDACGQDIFFNFSELSASYSTLFYASENMRKIEIYRYQK